MIKNEKQYKITKGQLNLLTDALGMSDTDDSMVHPLLKKAQREALQSEVWELNKQIETYEALKAGIYNIVELDSFDLLPQGLIKARIAKGLTQRELAEKLGLKEQQIQKYESSNYASASFERLKQIIKAMEINIREDIFLTATSYNITQLFKNLSKIGISQDLILKRIIPEQLAYKLTTINELAENEAANVLAYVSSIIARVFNLDVNELNSPNLSLDTRSLYPVRYKKTISANQERVSAYTFYAHMLALTMFQASKVKVQLPIPQDSKVVRDQLLKTFGEVTFESVIKYIWSLGIPVIALNDSGAFHGACWRIDGFNVIVLKQAAMSEARWTFDALHELCHASQHPNQDTLAVVETNDITIAESESDDEEEANFYAAEIYLGENADDLVEECIIEAKGNMNKLKTEVVKIARKNKVDVGGLANYMAFRLAHEQNHNWWGTANNLQTLGFSPWELCRRLILENCELDMLNDFDRELLTKALF